MSKLYTSLARVYHEVYQTLFNYDEEFEFYDKHLKSNKINSVVEIGCGTGNLAKRFVNAYYDYLGIDLFQEMLDIASENAPAATFLQSDVRNLKLNKKFDCAIITGRSISYLIENQGIIEAFKNLNESLNPDGIVMFDAIDANLLFSSFDESKKDILNISFAENHYKRVSKSKKNLNSGWTWDWSSEYFLKNGMGEYQSIGKDFSTLRAFLKEEIELFLKLTDFELIEILPKKSYTWDDNFFIARKK
jgi:SAM-dependent methyltransferase